MNNLQPTNTIVNRLVEDVAAFAEVALYEVTVLDEEFPASLAGISRVVSDSGVENFGEDVPPRPLAFRRNVTSISFRVDVFNCETSARWMLHFWS